MTIKEINFNYEKIRTEIYNKLIESTDINNNNVVYELTKDEIDSNCYEYFVNVYDRDGVSVELGIKKIFKNGIIKGYRSDLGEDKKIGISDIYDIEDKLHILNILNDYYGNTH
jgi:hypothetical protein